MLPSSDAAPTNIVNIIPNIHVVVEFMYLDNLPICTLSDIFDIIFNDSDISANGIIIPLIIFPVMVIINNIVGCKTATDFMLPSCKHKCHKYW